MKFLVLGIVLVLGVLQLPTTTLKAQQIGTTEVKGQVIVDSKEAEDKFYAINNNFGCILPAFDSSERTFISAKVVSKLSFSNVLAVENNSDQTAILNGYDYTIFANQKLDNELISENKIQSAKNFEAVSIPAKNLVNIPKNGAETGENKIQSSEIKKGFATNTTINYQVGITGVLKGDASLKLKADPKIKLECGAIFSYLFNSQPVGGFIWQDINANGLQDAGEPALPEVEVYLYDEKCETYFKKTVTDSAGYYKFDKLENKKYCLKLTPNIKYLPTQKVGSASDTNNSKLESNWQAPVTQSSLEYDFGLSQNKEVVAIINSSATNSATNSASSKETLAVCEECELALATSTKRLELPRTGGINAYQWAGIIVSVAIFIALVSGRFSASKSRELAVVKKD